MVIDHNLEGAICHRLHVFGVPPVWHRQFAALVNKWVTCSGEEWTVKRLKSLKVDLFRDRSGLPVITPAKKSCKGSFYGVIGSLFRYARKSERTFQSVLNAFMCYSLFKSQKLTENQIEKFMTAVNADTNSVSEQFLRSFASFVKSQNKNQLKIGSPDSVLIRRGSPSKKAPILNHRSMIQEGSGLAALEYFKSPAHMGLYRKYESIYSHVVEGCSLNTLLSDVTNVRVSMHSFDTMGGEVHFLQEPGYKLRAIASPYLVHQVALQPLGKALYDHCRVVPWDCTHDRDYERPLWYETKRDTTVSKIQAHLSSGRKAYSVDLSNATDYFPLEVQVKALQALIGYHPSIDLFVEISRSLWQSTIGPIQWKQGQPLGVYPSFAAFALTHGYLLLYLLGKEYNNEFFVLGDDVVILDDLLYTKYIQMLEVLGCPYSPDKSIISDELVEFAGKVITRNAVMHSYKWREVSNDNFIDLIRNYGRRAVSLLSPIQRRIVDKVQYLIEPIGLNWSYPGSNLEIMTRETNLIYKQKDKVEQSQTELYTTLNKNIYSTPNSLVESEAITIRGKEMVSRQLLESIDIDSLKLMSSTFDEKVAVTFQQYFPKEWVDNMQMRNLLAAYAGMPQVVKRNLDLPMAIWSSSRVSQLEFYRKLLDM